MLYEYQCNSCAGTTEGIRKMDDRDLLPTCQVCGILMDRRILTAPSVNFSGLNIEAYQCVATGEVITSMTQRDQLLKKNGLVDCREFPDPDWEKMDSDHAAFHEQANKPVDIPDELREAMVREGHADLL